MNCIEFPHFFHCGPPPPPKKKGTHLPLPICGKSPLKRQMIFGENMEAKKSREKLFLSWVGGKTTFTIFHFWLFCLFLWPRCDHRCAKFCCAKKNIFTTQMQLKCKSRDTHLNTQNKYVAWCWMHFCLKSQPMFFLFHLGVKLACLKSLLIKKHCFNYIRWPSIFYFAGKSYWCILWNKKL